MSGEIEIKLLPKSVYVPLIYQPIYKVVQILAILNYNTGRSKSASITLLHFITWAMRTKANKIILLDYITGKRDSFVPWCFEPALDKAIIIATINDYCTRQVGGKIKITTKGKELIKKIEDNSLFAKKIQDLLDLGEIKENECITKNWEIK